MKRRIFKKNNKITSKTYRGQRIEKNGPYTIGIKCKIILFYNFDGNEIYFNKFNDAKKYIDSNFNEFVKYNNKEHVPF